MTEPAVTDAAVTDPAITDPAVNTDPTDLEATMSAVLGTEPTAADPAARPRKVAVWDVPANTRRGGDLRTLLSPATVGATSGFMGVATLQPGEFISEHYHPYSEEFLYVVSGSLQLRVDGEPLDLGSGEGILLPANTRHRLLNVGRVPLFVVFHLGPLAPRPELGHVDTEPYPEPAPPAPAGPAASDASAGPR